MVLVLIKTILRILKPDLFIHQYNYYIPIDPPHQKSLPTEKTRELAEQKKSVAAKINNFKLSFASKDDFHSSKIFLTKNFENKRVNMETINSTQNRLVYYEDKNENK